MTDSEQKFRAVFDQATIGIALGTLEGRCLRANRAACEFIGATEREVCRLRIQDIVHPEDLDLTARLFQRLVAGEIPSYTVERRYVRRDGRIVWGRASVSLVRDEKGRPNYLVGVMVDVTREKTVEKQQEAFSQLGHRLSVAISTDQAAHIILEIASDLFGWDAGFFHLYSPATDKVMRVLAVDTIEGRRIPVPPAMRSSEPSPMMRRVMQEGGCLILRGLQAAPAPKLLPFGDKQHLSASLMFVPVHSAGGVVGIVSIQSYRSGAYSSGDLTLLQALADLCGNALARIKATEALREAEANYRGIFENATEGIFQTTPDGRYLSANPALARMFGYDSPREMMASISDIGRQTYVIPKQRQELKRLLAKHHSVQRFEAKRYRKDGTVFWISIDGHEVRDASGNLLYYEGTNQDITEIVQAREALARSHEELECIVQERTAQLERVNESLRNEMAERQSLERQVLESVEHEQERIGQDLHDGVCQLMTGIKFKVASLRAQMQDQGLPGADQTAAIEELANEAMRQGYGLARGLNPVKLSGHGLALALKELAASVATAFNVSCLCQSRRPVNIADSTVTNHLYRIAQEATHNAVKHGKARHVALSLNQRAGELILAIRDDGIGIPPNADRKGGMGLQNMKARARMIGASLQIRARKSGGAEVTCSLKNPEP
ncbi:MAG TPA: PAS domain S-box protein [Candidatus Acidoferrum sp.]|nr:PAS domain S-box protein [Candidatus Acidoferrum sp.]